MRDAFDRARDAGTNLAFLGANIGYWQVRYELAERTIVGYKSPADPVTDPALRTVYFRDLDRPECQLLGVMHQGGLFSGSDPSRDYVVTARADDPWLAGTGLGPGSIVSGILGPEWDTVPRVPPAGCLKPGLEVLFEYTGLPIGAHSVRYTAPSGARVFSAGSLRFAWGLDTFAPRTRGGLPTAAHTGLQQFMRNMLADQLRPAPPVEISAIPVGAGTFRIRVVGNGDPRIEKTIISRGGYTVCETTSGECVEKGLRGHRSYSYSAVAADRWGESQPKLAGPFLMPNTPPRLSLHGPRRVRRGGQVTYSVRAKDADRDRLTYRWRLDRRRLTTSAQRLTLRFDRVGRHVVAVEARDGYGGKTAARIIVRCRASNASPR
jgi:hypothetical protein